MKNLVIAIALLALSGCSGKEITSSKAHHVFLCTKSFVGYPGTMRRECSTTTYNNRDKENFFERKSSFCYLSKSKIIDKKYHVCAPTLRECTMWQTSYTSLSGNCILMEADEVF